MLGWLAQVACACSGSHRGTAPGGNEIVGKVDCKAGAPSRGCSALGKELGSHSASSTHWVGTWACGPQTTEPQNLPPSPGLQGNTLRQAIHVSVGGKLLRLRLSNEYGVNPVTMDSVHVAAYLGLGQIDVATDKLLTFSGSAVVVIQPGNAITSDPFDYDLAPLSDLAISIHFASMSGGVTGHPGSRTTSYLQSGNAVTSAGFTAAETTDHWYFITGLDVIRHPARPWSCSATPLQMVVVRRQITTIAGQIIWRNGCS